MPARAARGGGERDLAAPGVTRTTRPATPRAPRRPGGTSPGPGPRARRARRSRPRAARSRSPRVRPQPHAGRPQHDVGGARRDSGWDWPVSVRCSAPVISRTSSAASTSPRVARRDRLARAHHRDAVADLLDLVHPVRDEDRARSLAREPADDREQPVARRDVERRGRLVEHEDLRPPDQRARDAARLPVAERELLDGAARGRSRRPSARAASRTRARGARPARRRRDGAGRCRARRCRGSSAAARPAPPGRRRRSRGRAPPAVTGRRRASGRPPRSSRRRAGGRR